MRDYDECFVLPDSSKIIEKREGFFKLVKSKEVTKRREVFYNFRIIRWQHRYNFQAFDTFGIW
jgi:hypothetical protein